jgi:hypothetical protein
MRKLAVALAALALLAGAGTASAGRGGGGAPLPQIPRVPGQWAHVEINLRIGRIPHTIILDRGPIAQVSTTAITVRELGNPVVVPISDQTLIVLDGSAATTNDLRRKMPVVTMRIDGGAAVRVRATSF